MVARMAAAPESVFDDELVDLVQQYQFDPLGYAIAMFPWGEPGTPLENWPDGPDIWQATVMRDIGAHMLSVAAERIPDPTTQIAVRSGHGIGKSALISMLIMWFLATRTTPQAVVTAGTKTQLETKLWRELKKWHELAVNRDWFEWQATSFSIKGEGKMWAANAIPWSRDNPAAFQGTHEQDVLMVYDEASAVEDMIWEASEGAFTTRGGLWICFGNPTAETGRFAECFERFKHRWLTYTIDSRTAKAADHRKMEEWVRDYGEDSDFVRVRVRGLPPKTSASGLFSASEVREAIDRDIEEEFIPTTIPLVCGIDVAHGGDARTVMAFRRGPLIREKDLVKFSEANHMHLADRIAAVLAQRRPEVAFLDAHGAGKGVYDRLVQLGFSNVVASYSGDRSVVLDKLIYLNPRAEWWGRMKKWMSESKIPGDSDLLAELIAQPVEYDQMNRLKLMSKQDMREQGLASPDTADAVALTFAQTVAPLVLPGAARGGGLPEIV
jgi:hypothetical protein